MRIRHPYRSPLATDVCQSLHAQETLPPLNDSQAPQNYAEMWSGFDPRAEPLETEILHEWKKDEAVLRVVRFRIGVFKGETARLAAVYDFPKAAPIFPVYYKFTVAANLPITKPVC